MNNVDLISKELWDHYSGLPNPSWYQYKKELGEEEDTEDIIDLGNSNEEIQTQKKKVQVSDESISPKTRQGLLHWAYIIS